MCPEILFEPIGETIDCGDDETLLDAAFRAGYNLVYGCREGQCSACKCYLLEGEVSLDRYSTFALSDTEQEQGYTLLCRALPDSDVVIELLHFDPDDYRLEHPIADGVATVTALDAPTHDITRLELTVDGPFDFTPGQYVDLWVPGSDGAQRRSFSMANLPGGGRIELLIKRYAGGRIAEQLADGTIAVGEPLRFTGPYGAMRLRPGDGAVLLAAGGSGMAPVLALLRQLAAAGSARPVRFVYGARTEADLLLEDEVRRLGERLADFAFCPVLSDAEWDGAHGFVHEAVDAQLRAEPLDDGARAYVCGPPPMVEAVCELLADAHGVDEQQISFDKFTTAEQVGAS